MIVVSLLLILVAVALLGVGLAAGSNALLFGSIAASMLAAIMLYVGARQAAADSAPTTTGEPEAPGGASRAGASQARASRAGAFRIGAFRVGSSQVGSSGAGAERGVQGTRQTEPAAARTAPEPSGLGERSSTLVPAAPEPPASPEPRGPGTPSSPTGLAEAASNAKALPPPRDALPLEAAPPSGAVPLAASPAQAASPAPVPFPAAASGGPATPAGAATGTVERDAGTVEQDEELAEDEYDDEDPPDEPAEQQVSAPVAAKLALMSTEVLVIDGRPRYHLPSCDHLHGRESEPLPVSEAVELGFTPCSRCQPVRALLAQAQPVV